MTEEETKSTKKESEKIILINTWFKIVLISSITGTILYKIITFSLDITKFDLSKFDFSDLLSLILAIFSIGLSVMFYIKADETSNRFYDNTQKFTRDISEILGRIEAGFGEKLKHIDEGYSKFIEDYYSNGKPLIESKLEEKENEEIKKKEQDDNKIIQNLIDKSKLDSEQKDMIVQMEIPVISHTHSGALRTVRRGKTLVEIIVHQVCDIVRNPLSFLWESPNKFSR